jgi:hypothetical protein
MSPHFQKGLGNKIMKKNEIKKKIQQKTSFLSKINMIKLKKS